MISPDKLQIAVETLCQSLLYDANSNIRVKAAEALGQLGSERAIPSLCQAWEQDRNLSVRLAAADAMVQIIKPAMTDPSINQPTFNINQVGNINTGDVNIQGDQIGVQQNYGAEQTFEQLFNDYKQFIAALQQQHPVATEATAIQIIDAEFKELERTQPLRWQNFLNLKRLWNGGKKAAVKVGEHFTDQNPWGKGAIAFLEGVMEEPK